MRKTVCCIRCRIKLHPTDWELLKYKNQMPICDECDIKYSNENKAFCYQDRPTNKEVQKK
jgi:hypothetical protein